MVDLPIGATVRAGQCRKIRLNEKPADARADRMWPVRIDELQETGIRLHQHAVLVHRRRSDCQQWLQFGCKPRHRMR